MCPQNSGKLKVDFPIFSGHIVGSVHGRFHAFAYPIAALMNGHSALRCRSCDTCDLKDFKVAVDVA